MYVVLISTELHLSVFSAETISSGKVSIDTSDTLIFLFVKNRSEHRYDIRISESCVHPNPLMVKRQDPDNFTRFQTRERCALEIAAYVFNEGRKYCRMQIFDLHKAIVGLENHC